MYEYNQVLLHGCYSRHCDYGLALFPTKSFLKSETILRESFRWGTSTRIYDVLNYMRARQGNAKRDVNSNIGNQR